jgi:hypothetical protein
MKNRLGIVLALCLIGCDRDADPKGEGSTSAGEEMFAEIANVPSGSVPPGYTRFDFEDGSWIAVRGIDSHKSPDGGTVGMMTNTGESAVIFTHVCGPGPTPLEGLIPDAESASKALASVRASSKEYKNANKP